MNRISLTQRLTLMFVLAASAVLLILGWVIARAVEQHFEDLDLEVLSGKMELTRQALQRVSSHDGLTEFTHQLAYSLVGHHGMEVMVIDADEAVIFATGHAGFDPALVMQQAANAPERPALWQLDGQTYRGLAARLPTAVLDATGQPLRVFVAVATDIVHHQAFMQSFLQTLWLFVAGAALLTGVLGWVAVRRGLAPLRAMRAQAQAVTAQQLDQRLPVQTIPRELAELAQSLNDMLARLQDAFQRLTDFSSDIAHELRTPVSNLLTQTQVTLTRARSADDYRRILESNAEEFERMARMISDMLLLAKSDNGLEEPQRERLRMADEVRALFDYFDAVAEEKNVALSLTGDCELSADRLMLRRALANLLSNALRHADPGSVVSVSLQTFDENVQVSVSDHGERIAPEHLERVFDRFFRVDPARQRSSEGTGLGLAITQSIVQAHGGTIRATSAAGVTTFTMFLPRT
ncbi:heavy metal sensor histidine kinase [Rhodoferax sp.]|uniref:heavy metal sensor histidine kinase n=1 Tax=Rhodoferax sp. TaxID=50421 RepID=UPI00260D9DE6|nr:heavy metal sensor histidine kinase [Rhodoferax sp.]MDD2918576.1 heavy metal sensor histidine kinase [Rhodoferax sp.]